MPEVAVEAQEIATGVIHRSVTDAAGRFEFPSLSPGNYVVRVSKAGFATTVQQGLALTVGRTISLTLTLQVAGSTTTVTVTKWHADRHW